MRGRSSTTAPTGDVVGQEALRLALKEGRLSLAYQPKIHVQTGVLAGVEALARWHDEERGWIDPATFISVAESAGLIDELTEWGLCQALDDWLVWRQQGLLTHISFNISAASLHDLSFPDRVEEQCRVRNMPTQHLTLELTESASQQIIPLTDTLTRFRIKGMSVALDDFGTGYSSLVQLRTLPFTELKIDRCFVEDMTSADDSRKITKAVVGLAHALGLSVTAEGVGNFETLSMLAAIDCDQAQGNFISPAISAGQVPSWSFDLPRSHIRMSAGTR